MSLLFGQTVRGISAGARVFEVKYFFLCLLNRKIGMERELPSGIHNILRQIILANDTENLLIMSCLNRDLPKSRGKHHHYLTLMRLLSLSS